jgi:hypothetical protein
VLLNGDPPLWQAHVDLQRRFGYDAIVGAGLDNDRSDHGVTTECTHGAARRLLVK